MKQCTKCKEIKNLTEFNKNKLKKDGFDIYCKRCKSLFAKIYYETESCKTHHSKSQAKYQKTEKYYISIAKYRKNNPFKIKAHWELNNAITRGDIIRQPCEICGYQKTEGHHKSYYPDEWLNVQWLCRKHHSNWHKNFLPAIPKESFEVI